jgi:hypothetical protein
MALFRRDRTPSDAPWAPELMRRSLHGKDFKYAQTWTVLDWCLRHDASEFTVHVLTLGDIPLTPQLESTLRELEQFSLGREVRPELSNYGGSSFRHEVELWELNPVSAGHLKELLPVGLLSYVSDETGWVEDPHVFREGEIMFGSISHEDEGVVQARSDELEELERMGVRLRLDPEWL